MERLVGFSSFVISGRVQLLGNLSRGHGIKHVRIWINADSRKVEAICIPATRYGRVVAISHLGVILARVNKQLKLLVGHIKKPGIT
jgi:hypothetical protein